MTDQHTTVPRPSKNIQDSHNQQTKQNQKQTHATHINKTIRGNYNTTKENGITVSSRILDHKTCTPEDGQLGRNM
jgi:hypothetical protein